MPSYLRVEFGKPAFVGVAMLPSLIWTTFVSFGLVLLLPTGTSAMPPDLGSVVSSKPWPEPTAIWSAVRLMSSPVTRTISESVVPGNVNAGRSRVRLLAKGDYLDWRWQIWADASAARAWQKWMSNPTWTPVPEGVHSSISPVIDWETGFARLHAMVEYLLAGRVPAIDVKLVLRPLGLGFHIIDARGSVGRIPITVGSPFPTSLGDRPQEREDRYRYLRIGLAAVAAQLSNVLMEYNPSARNTFGTTDPHVNGSWRSSCWYYSTLYGLAAGTPHRLLPPASSAREPALKTLADTLSRRGMTWPTSGTQVAPINELLWSCRTLSMHFIPVRADESVPAAFPSREFYWMIN